VPAGLFVPILLQVLVAPECDRRMTSVYSWETVADSSPSPEREVYNPLEPCFPMNERVLPFSHVNFSLGMRSRSTMVLPFRNPYRSSHRPPLGGQFCLTQAAQEYQLGPPGNSRTSLPTWFGDLIPHPSGTVRNPKRGMVLPAR